LPLLARAWFVATAAPPGPEASATEAERAAAGPAPVTALAEPWATAVESDTALELLCADAGPKPDLLSASLLAIAGPPCAVAVACELLLLVVLLPTGVPPQPV